EDQPQRNRHQRQQHEFARGAADPRITPRAEDDAVGEQDESGPGDRRVPRVERFDAEDGCRLRHDHDAEAEPQHHVTRTLSEHPASAGAPTPLPRIRTFIVLPRPPGITRVLSAAARSARVSAVLSEKAEPFAGPWSAEPFAPGSIAECSTRPSRK